MGEQHQAPCNQDSATSVRGSGSLPHTVQLFKAKKNGCSQSSEDVTRGFPLLPYAIEEIQGDKNVFRLIVG